MFKSYWKTALRNLTRNRFSAFINIGGLAIGMAVAMLIGLWIHEELSYNTSHDNYARIAKVQSNANYSGKIFTVDSHPMPLAGELQTSYASDFKYVVMSTHEQHTLSSGDKKFNTSGNFMQPDAADMLSLKMLSGSRKGLEEVNGILLSESLAKKLFANENPVNQIIRMDNTLNAKVTGVYADIADNSDFSDVAFIAPFGFYLSSFDWAKNKYNDWNNIAVTVYVQLNEGIEFAQASSRIKNVLASHVAGDFEFRKPQLFLHPMNRWHLYSKFENGVNVMSDQLQVVWFYGIVGAMVLLLACINFMNLSTARSEKRAKEVGIRKAMGSERSQLIRQFFSESIVVSVFAFIVAMVLVQVSLPWFNEVAGTRIHILWTSPLFWIASLAFILFTGGVAGSYPALYLSSFNPVKVLKGGYRVGRLASIPRKALVVLQFTASMLLIIGTIIVYRQIQFAKNRPVGYTAESLLQVRINSPEFQQHAAVFENEVRNTGVVKHVAASASPVTSIWSTNKGFTWTDMENTSDIEFSTISVSSEYGKAVGWQFIEGRDFSNDLASDSSGLVINEAAAKLMGMTTPVGHSVTWDQVKEKPFKILGVVKNMVMESPFAKASPTLFFIYRRDGANYMFLKINPGINAGVALSTIEAVFKKVNPSTIFEYSFVTDEFSKKFEAEERISTLSSLFALLAIIISCLGLFGLASFVAEQRTKEIGVRKVLGASAWNIWSLISKDFVALFMISFLISVPVAYYFMDNWLQNYAIRTPLSWWIFALGGMGTLILILCTVSFQALKAAMVDPVKSLRTE